MNQPIMIMISILFPVLFGLWMLIKPEFKERKQLILTSAVGLVVTLLISLMVVFGENMQLDLFSFGKNMNVYFAVDDTGRLFALLVMAVWVLAGFYAFEYMKHEKEEKRYFGFYVITFGILMALTFAGNMVTYYLFYEMMSLLTVPLILHSKTKEAIMGGLKYLFYSLFGAYLVLFGIFFLNKYAETLDFTAGGVLGSAAAGHEGILLVAAFA